VGGQRREQIDYLGVNARAWDEQGEAQLALARRAWATDEPSWGIFNVPEGEVRLLPDDAAGMRVAELGCGTAYVSAWLARRGARPVGIDPSAGQLAIAQRMQEEHGLHFPLARAAGEEVPLRSGAFDLVISEYGAAIWADPYRWVPEAARLLRPGGELTFLGNSTLLMLCVPDDEGEAATDRLRRDQFGMYRFTWPDDPTIEFHLSHGDWVRLLRANGFVVEDLIELRAPAEAATHEAYDFVTADWARRWPSEEAWRARRSAG
jgi:SAM-dependent methyltransferase